MSSHEPVAELSKVGESGGLGAPGTADLGSFANQNQPLLTVKNLRTEFSTPAGPLVAVSDSSFRVESGRTLGVVGESGSGKSVTFRSVMRLLPKSHVKSTGSVTFDGVDMTALSSRQLRDMWGPALAMVFQDPLGSLNPVMKIGKQVGEGLRVHEALSRRAARATALDLLESVGITEPQRRIDEYPHQLSGGMRQRVVIAIALACSPMMLIADEPTTALDVTVQAQILDLLLEHRRQRDMALVLITHDLGVIAGRADEIMVMYAGRIVEQASTQVLFSQMAMPYTEALLAAIPTAQHPSHTKLNTIGGRPPNMVNPPTGCRFAPRCKYAQPICTESEPPLREGKAPGHSYRCFLPVGSPEGAAALERNIAEGRVSEEGVVIGA